MLTVPSYAAEAPADVTARSHRWLRFLRPLLVTALGFALTAWLVPAMTRQWDDRQKEHELKAGIVADIGSATARALVGGEAVWSGRRVTARDRARLANEWALSALGMEAKLRTYFPASVVRSWEVYSWAVDRFIRAQSVSASAALQDAVADGTPLDPRVADAAAQLLALGESTIGPVPTFKVDPASRTPISDGKSIAQLRRMLSLDLKRYEAAPVVATWTALEKRLLGFEQAVADQILRDHAAGFSTTSGDLVHDLVP